MDAYKIIRPFLFSLPPERAHALAIRYLARRRAPGGNPFPGILSQTVAGLTFPAPVGLAAGFDKNAEAVGGAFATGFGFAEAGTVTPRPQPGNPAPRIFRLRRDAALINRLGFNNEGAESVAARLGALRVPGGHLPGPLGVNIGAGRDSADKVADYETAARKLAPFADYLAVNISSPNTPGLRDLQSPAEIARLTAAVEAGMKAAGAIRPVFVKLAPDLTGAETASAARAIEEAGAAGIIVSNTTVERPSSLKSSLKSEPGGLSGRPLMDLSTARLRTAHEATGGRLPLIGAGGVFTLEDVLEKFRAGAALVQLYTGLVYEGPGLPARLNRDLANWLKARNLPGPQAIRRAG